MNRKHRSTGLSLLQLLLGLILLPLLIYAGIKLYIYWQVKSNLDDAIAMLRPFADLKYQGIRSELSGAVAVEGLRVRPHEFEQTLRIDEISVRAPDLATLLGGAQGFKESGELPESMQLAVRGARLGIADLGVFRNLQLAMAKAIGLEWDACSLANPYSLEHMDALGFSEWVIDADIQYEFMQAFPGITFVSYTNLRGMTSYQATLELLDVERNLGSWLFSNPRPRQFSLYWDVEREFAARSRAYCAELRGVDEEAYVQQLAAEPDEAYMLAFGFVPGPELKQALLGIATRGGSMHITGLPSESLDFSQLHLYQPEQYAALFGITVTADGEPVEDLSISLLDLSQYVPEAMEHAGMDADKVREMYAPDLEVTASDGDGRAFEPRREPARYRPVSGDQLAQHIGKQVRIVATGNRRRSGRLVSIEGGVATLEQRLKGGTFTTRVALADVQNAEVFY